MKSPYLAFAVINLTTIGSAGKKYFELTGGIERGSTISCNKNAESYRAQGNTVVALKL